MFPSEEPPKPPIDDHLSNEVVFEDDNTTVGSNSKVTLESDQGNEAQANPIDDSKPSKPHDGVDDDDDKKS